MKISPYNKIHVCQGIKTSSRYLMTDHPRNIATKFDENNEVVSREMFEWKVYRRTHNGHNALTTAPLASDFLSSRAARAEVHKNGALQEQQHS